MKMIIIILLINCALISAQNSTKKENISLSSNPSISSEDTMKLAFERLKNELSASKNMLEVMEKTNSQLNLWSNPMSIFVGALGVLFTLLAIVFAFVIFRQSKEYKEQINNLIQSYQTALKKLVEDWETRIKKIDEQIDNYDSKLASATDEQKKVFEKEIEKLKRERETVNFPLSSSAFQIPGSGSIPGFGVHGFRFVVCGNCGNTFSIPSGLPDTAKYFIKCPACESNNINYI